MIEARKPKPTPLPCLALCHRSIHGLELWVRHKGKEVFTCDLIPYNLPEQDPKHRYRGFQDRDHSTRRREGPMN